MDRNKPNKLVMCLYEGMGMIFIMITLNWSNYDPMSLCLTYFAISLVFGPISGGHFNPAVSIAIFTKEFYEGGYDLKLLFMRLLF